MGKIESITATIEWRHIHPSTVDSYIKDYKKGKIEWLEK